MCVCEVSNARLVISKAQGSQAVMSNVGPIFGSRQRDKARIKLFFNIYRYTLV